MKNTFKNIFKGVVLPLSFLPLIVPAQTFTPAAVTQTVFPVVPIAYPIGSPTTPLSTFYQNRCGGSAYHHTTDAYGLGDYDINLWGYSYDLIEGFNAGISYSINVTGTPTPIYRGLAYVGSDVTEVHVGMYRINSKVYPVVFDWQAAAGPELHTFELVPTVDGLVHTTGTGGTPPGIQSVAPRVGTNSQHLAMDSHDMDCFAIAWEEPGTGVKVRAYRVNSGVIEQSSGPGSLTGFPDLILPSNSLRLPDLAITHDPASGKRMIQIAAVDTLLSQIDEFSIDLDLLFTAPAWNIDDVYPISGYSSGWDEFQLSIDAPDHFTPAGIKNSWSYAYYNNDANKINVRVCDGTVGPPAKATYTVNDGSMGNAPINSDGNAFPTIAYDNTGNEMYVGWYTTYDPNGGGPYPLYSYAATGGDGKRYVAIKMSVGGAITSSNDYLDVQNNYVNNWIGSSGFGRPGITFSKHNECDYLLTTYTSHEETFRWTDPAYGAYVGPSYAEGGDCVTSTGKPTGTIPLYVNYPDYYIGSCISQKLDFSPGFETRVIYAKMMPWASGSFFSPTALKSLNSAGAPIKISNNPFNDERRFELAASNLSSEKLKIELIGLDGRIFKKCEGSIADINDQIKKAELSNLASGYYFLKVFRQNGSVERNKLIKL